MGLQAKNTLNLTGAYYSGGYVGEDTGATGQYQDWTEVPLSGTSTATYWYSDSDSGDNANSIKTYVDIEERWVAVRNSDNSIDVNYTTTIKKIEKRDVRGYPGTLPRTIKVATSPNSTWLHAYIDTPLTPYIVAQNLETVSGTIHLPPLSDSGGISTIYFKSGWGPHFDDPLPSPYVDAMGVGTSFRNTLPYIYRPGQRKVNGTWKSHNRNGGVADRKGYGTMETSDGGVGTTDPPFRKTNNVWKNQRKLGDES